ncbi:MAG: dihydroneopterin aldolase [Bacteroidota bacterium]|jgi:dihydroneopterin aldolase|nr:dihydroneopterin aldolase [Bacteroidales bacterium]MDI9535902.1 dihydroneopterin aldolase [Bacteroidota bacterium]OQC45216.1 MAG: Dihydroneopterin aldolase [Bacteroidetes bacterium ADurb.Bin028]NLP20050.1 dihydroneopterin aldolase [Bacteroidales bacterium]HNY43130.1 dihydroneopterin aldolase [Bacteroidales bacterium]
MNKILITGMEFFAFHGHYEEEKLAGNKFVVDLTLWYNTRKAEQSDNLEDALNYQSVYISVKEVISNTKVNLLEHLAAKILDTLFSEFDNLRKAEVYLKKVNPPMGGQIKDVGVVMRKKNKKEKK